MRNVVRAGVRMATVLVIAPTLLSAHAQKPKGDICPWCRNDPELMKKAGIVSHGPMPIGPWSSADVPAKLPASQWVFIETEHIRWASSLPSVVVDQVDRARVEAELARLKLLLPDVPEKIGRLDPWLRLHLKVMKGEDFYARFQRLLAVTDADFPAERSATGPFMGAGRFLGEKDKFEIVLHSAHKTHQLFTKEFSGAQVTGALRWHFPVEHKMLASIPCSDPDLKQDRWLFPHVVHNLSHLFYSAYKHFSYDPPTWIDEGLALAMEKEINPRAATNEGEEGTFRDRIAPPDWDEEVRKMIERGRHKKVAELMSVKEVGSLDPDALYTSWSIVRYWIEEHPEGLAKLLGGTKGQLDDKGYPSGKDLPGLQRQLLKDVFGWTPSALDEEWKAWATRPLVPAK